MVTQHGRAMADHVQTWCHGLRLAGVSRPAVGVKSQAAQAQYESTCGCVIFKMTGIIKDLYGNSGDRFEKINTRMNFLGVCLLPVWLFSRSVAI